MTEIISIEPLDLKKRLTNPILANSLISCAILLFVSFVSKSLLAGILTAFLYFFLSSLPYLSVFKYYIYKISYHESMLSFEYYIWNTKQILSVDFQDIKIDYVSDIYMRSVFKKIIIMKKQKKLLEILPRVNSITTLFGDEDTVLDLYEKLIEIQKQARLENKEEQS